MSSDSSSSESEYETLQYDLKSLEKRVKLLRQHEEELKNKPIEHDVQLSQENVERETLQNQLLLYKLAGITVLQQEGRELVFQFTPSVKGKYFEPYYLRISKSRTEGFEVLCYCLPDSILVRELVLEKPLTTDAELIRFLQYVHRCVVAYHSRKAQILSAKELVTITQFFFSSDFMLVEMTLKTSEAEDKPITVKVSLIYECDKDLPSTFNVYSEGTDEETLTLLKEELRPFATYHLDVAVDIIFVKNENSFEVKQEQDDVETNEEESDDTKKFFSDLYSSGKKASTTRRNKKRSK